METLPPLAFGWNRGLFPTRPMLHTHPLTPFYFESFAQSRKSGGHKKPGVFLSLPVTPSIISTTSVLLKQLDAHKRFLTNPFRANDWGYCYARRARLSRGVL